MTVSPPIFPELRPILDETFEIFGGKSEFMVAAPQYQAAAQGIRHTPCAVLKIASVTHQSPADGTAECACYYADGTAECACYYADGTAECAY
ncbi:MAG: hypothetical protein ACKN82_21425, partial [Pirellula sp.]